MSSDKNRSAKSKLKHAGMQIFSGGSAGFVEICMMHPLDVVKTRFQIQKGPDDPHHYRSIADCFRKMARTEGSLSFYKGILPPILAETPKRAVKFFSFEQYKSAFLFGSPTPTVINFRSGQCTCTVFLHSLLRHLLSSLANICAGSHTENKTFTLAGLCAGLTEGFVINPFEVVKVRLQSDRQKFSKQLSSYSVAREIIQANGLGVQGLNKGLTATLGRHGVFNMVYFSFYFSVKDVIPMAQDPTVEIMRKFAIGFVASVLASCINIPFDVAKSRIQGPQPVEGHIKYDTCLKTMRTIYTEEGLRALYKGLVPKVMRLGPGGAVMLMIYEQLYDYLKRKFGD